MTKDARKGLTGLAALVLGVAGLLLVNYHYKGKYETATQLHPAGSQSYVPKVSEVVRLSASGTNGVPVPVTKEAYDAARKAARAKDDIGYRNLLLAGQIFVVPNGTRARVLDISWGGAEVRILEGEYTGRTGWVPYDWLRPM